MNCHLFRTKFREIFSTFVSICWRLLFCCCDYLLESHLPVGILVLDNPHFCISIRIEFSIHKKRGNQRTLSRYFQTGPNSKNCSNLNTFPWQANVFFSQKILQYPTSFLQDSSMFHPYINYIYQLIIFTRSFHKKEMHATCLQIITYCFSALCSQNLENAWLQLFP